MSKPLQISDVGAVRVLTITSGAQVNPLSVDLQEALLASLQAIEHEKKVRAVLLTGSGRTFCVGADLTQLQNAGAPGTPDSVGNRTADTMETLTHRVVLAMQRAAVPVVCAVNGVATGAGVGLALSGDITVLAASAYFQLPFMTRLGIVPDAGASWFLRERLGQARATALTLLGEPVSAEQAVQWGLAWAAFRDQQMLEQALVLAGKLAALPAHAVQEVRALYRAASAGSLAGQLDYEASRQRVLLDAPTFEEGVRAFFAKRDPVFPERR